jgi:hypothetical protein
MIIVQIKQRKYVPTTYPDPEFTEKYWYEVIVRKTRTILHFTTSKYLTPYQAYKSAINVANAWLQ